MPSRLTFGSVKLACSRVLTNNTTDARVAEYVSRAQERLLYKGKWVGTYGRYRVCINQGCLTWPREIETIEMAALCNCPIDVRNEWYEFLGSGPGVQGEDCGIARQLIDRGDNCAFDDVVGTGNKLAVYCDGTEAAGAKILLRYYNSSGGKVYTTVSGESVEGEYITLPAGGGYAYSTYEVMPGGFYDVVKPATLRTVRIYQYTVVGGALKPLAYYEPDETNPVYRRSLIPGVSNTCGGEAADDECSVRSIDIMGKFRQRPVSKDSDALIIQSPEALRLMVQAIRAEENSNEELSMILEAKAEKTLREQLGHWIGDGAVVPIRVVGSQSWGGAIQNLI